MNTFDILMVLALGSLAGTGVGLTIGSAAKKRRKCSMIFGNEITLNLTLVVICSAICIAGLAWFSLI